MTDTPRNTQERAPDASIGWVMLVHVMCCGFPVAMLLLISAGVTINVLWQLAPYIAIVGAIVGVIWLVWYARRRCWTCSVCDTNAARHHAKEREIA